jgi:hypothetical protein
MQKSSAAQAQEWQLGQQQQQLLQLQEAMTATMQQALLMSRQQVMMQPMVRGTQGPAAQCSACGSRAPTATSRTLTQ